MFLKMEDFLSSTGGYGGNSANIRLSEAMLFVLIGEFDKNETDSLIKKYIADDDSVRTLYIFSDCEGSIVKGKKHSWSLPERERYLEEVKADSTRIREDIRNVLYPVINQFRSISFSKPGDLQVNYIFHAEDISSCTLGLVSDMIKEICAPSYGGLYEDFFCLVNDQLISGDEGQVKDAYKYLTFRELEDRLIPDMGPFGGEVLYKNCYCLSNNVGGVLRDIKDADHLKRICKLCVFKHGEMKVENSGMQGYFFNESSFKEECANKNPKGKFFTLGYFSLEKDSTLIQATLMKWIMDHIAGASSGNMRIGDEINTMRSLDVDTKLQEKISGVIKINDGEVQSNILFALSKKQRKGATLPDKNGELVDNLFGGSIEEFIKINLLNTLREKAVDELSAAFSSELERKLQNFIQNPLYSISDIISFLTDREEGLSVVCDRISAKNRQEKAAAITSFEAFRNKNCDTGNSDMVSVDGESAMVYSVAGRYILSYIAREKHAIAELILDEYEKIINTSKGKYESIGNTIQEFVNIFDNCVRNCNEALQKNPNDITKKRVKDYYKEVISDASNQYSAKFSDLYTDMNDLICDINLSDKEFKDRFRERIDSFMEFLYNTIPVLSENFFGECEKRLEGEDIGKLVENEIIGHRDNLYTMSFNGDANKEYSVIGMIGSEEDSTINYLLTSGLSGQNKSAYFDNNQKNDFDVIYIRGSFRAEDIVSYRKHWEPAYKELDAKEGQVR